ncbi:hypothetical protein SK128_016197, partial [Halocaridina rubra]
MVFLRMASLSNSQNMGLGHSKGLIVILCLWSIFLLNVCETTELAPSDLENVVNFTSATEVLHNGRTLDNRTSSGVPHSQIGYTIENGFQESNESFLEPKRQSEGNQNILQDENTLK